MAWCSIRRLFSMGGKTEAQGVAISPENLRVAENVTLICRCIANSMRSGILHAGTAIGTTRRGIGPATRTRSAAVPSA